MHTFHGSSIITIKIYQSRTKDDLPDRNNLQFAPAVFSQTRQIYGLFKSLIKEQIRRHLIDFEGQAKPSKIKSVMKRWSRRISMIIAKTAR